MMHRSILVITVFISYFAALAQRNSVDETQFAIAAWERAPHAIGDPSGIDLLNDLTVMYMMRGWADSAMLTSKRASELGEKMLREVQGKPGEMLFRRSYGSALDMTTGMCLTVGDPVGGVEYARLALENAEIIKDTSLIRNACHGLGRGFQMLGFDTLALEWHERYMGLLQNADNMMIADAMINHSHMQVTIGNVDSAVATLKDALRLNDPVASPINHMNICYGLTRIHLEKEMLDTAMRYAGIAREVLTEVTGSAAFQQWDIVEAQIDLVNSNAKDALRRTFAMDSLGHVNDNIILIGEALRLRVIAYAMLGRPNEAFRTSKEASRLSRLEFGVDKIRKLAYIQAEMAHQQELELRAAEVRERKRSRDTAMAGMGVALLLAFLLGGLMVQARRGTARLQAAHSALAAAQVQLISAEHERATEAVRVRIARDIHDDVGVELTRLALNSEELKANTSIGSGVRIKLDNVAESARRISALMSDVVWAVDPSADSAEHLFDRIRLIARRSAESSSLKVHTELRADDPNQQLHPEVKRDLQLLVKEALNNAVKYAQAQNIWIRLTLHSDSFFFQLTDDGVGFQGPRDGGHGMKNMQIRASRLGGELSIGQHVGGGTVVAVNGVLGLCLE